MSVPQDRPWYVDKTDFGALDFTCGRDGKDSYCKITVPVLEENVRALRRQILNQGTATLYLRNHKGELSRLLRLWATGDG